MNNKIKHSDINNSSKDAQLDKDIKLLYNVKENLKQKMASSDFGVEIPEEVIDKVFDETAANYTKKMVGEVTNASKEKE